MVCYRGREQIYLRNRGEEMDQKWEANKMGVQKERKIDK